MGDAGKSVVWISQRGYQKVWTENTEGAFDAARMVGFQHLKADLRSTKDGHIVLHREASLSNTCGRPLLVEEMRLADWREVTTRDDQKLLTFDRFIERYAGCNWVFEIKPEDGLRTLHLLKKWAERKKAEPWLNAQARLQLDGPRLDRLAQQLFPLLPRFASYREVRRARWATLAKLGGLAGIERDRTYALPRFVFGIDHYQPRMVEAFHRKGARVLAELPASPEDIQAAIRAGFDEILTEGLPSSLGALRDNL